ncbi:MAG: pyruvate kinase [Clostridiales bacterium]|nr:pyruvate kinase [Clostridiales bacterium]
MRKTKIVCTLGPASADAAMMAEMLKSGMNVARLNFSHGTHENHKKMIETFRSVRDGLGLSAAVMLDTKGPEIRTGLFPGGPVQLKEGQSFTLYAKEREGDERGCSVSYPDLIRQLKAGYRVLIDDGRIHLRVEEADEDKALCTVTAGGEVSNRKGINIPRVSIEMPYLSETDKKDLIFGVENNVDFIAASFVRRKEDVIALRKFIDYHGGHDIKIISKIENLEGIENFQEILAHSDGIMVARGDMGVEVEYEKLPGLQKRFIRACYASGKMAITATQMLDSMMHSPMPTRAEITDVANAVFDGTSAVMLSGETASGKYPVEAVRAMARIAAQAEKDAFDMRVYQSYSFDTSHQDTTDAICDAACTTARDCRAQAIIAVTKYGQTARGISKFRPFEPIVAATPVEKAYHQLSLSWGVYPVLSLNQMTTDELFQHAVDCAKQLDLVKNGDLVVITAGVPLNVSGTTNLLKVQMVGERA